MTKEAKPEKISKKEKLLEIDDSETQNNPGFFSRIYTGIESKYLAMSEWLTERGIPLSKFNDFLEEKGVPAFPLVASVFLIIIFLILFLLVFGLKSGVSITFEVQDFRGTPVDAVSLIVYNIDGDTENVLYSTGNLGDGAVLKLPLVVGNSYKFSAKKDGYDDWYKVMPIDSKDNQKIKITLEEVATDGLLTINAIDSSSGRAIALASATAKFSISGENKEISATADSSFNIKLAVPVGKDLDITISADGYQTKNIKYKLAQESEVRSETLEFDSANFSEGMSQAVILVVSPDGTAVEGAEVKVYNGDGEIIDDKLTGNDGKSLSEIATGAIIRFVVSKDNYKTFDSDSTGRVYRLLSAEETYAVNLQEGGNLINAKVIDSSSFLPLDSAEVILYNSAGGKIDSVISDNVGQARFTGLDGNSEYVITACRDDYLCGQQTIKPFDSSSAEFKLDKVTATNSALLYVYVVDNDNMPVKNAKVNLFIVKDSKELPYGKQSMTVDALGAVSVPLPANENFLVTAAVGDVNDFAYVTISQTKDNKVILYVDVVSKMVTLQLLDVLGSPLAEGSVIVKSADGAILYDGNVGQGEITFDNQGYSDLVVEYTSADGTLTTASATVPADGKLNVSIRPQATGSYPVIEFAGIEDLSGKKVSYMAVGNDYYLLFDVQFPESAKIGGLHVRAGNDTETDSEGMSYGIAGFKADTKSFKYSTTYNPLPEPGNQAIDMTNSGTAGEINKWIELYWNEKQNLGNKQVKIKARATDSSISKLSFNYRVWWSADGNVYRDPIDSDLEEKSATSIRSGLYAEAKTIQVDLFDVPADCKDDVCISYQFVDKDGTEFNPNDFYALKDEKFALKLMLLSLKNEDVSLMANTSVSSPLITFTTISDNQDLLGSGTYSEALLDINKDGISLTAGQKKTIYLNFIAVGTGVSYIDTIVSGLMMQKQEKKINFNINTKNDLLVVIDPPTILPYNSKLNIDVSDASDGRPIEDAFIKIYDEQNRFLKSIKGSRLNGAGGKYILENTFETSKLNLEISAYGYNSYKQEIIVADNTVLQAPAEVTINLGEGEISDAETFTVRNKSNLQLTNIQVPEPVWMQSADTLSLEIKPPLIISPNSTGTFEINAIASKDSKFTSAKAIVTVYGFVGSKQVAKTINVTINRGRITERCLLVKPDVLSSYVGKENGSENTIIFKISNSCEKMLVLDPEIKIAGSTKDDLNIYLNQLTIQPGEEKDYEITIKNSKDRKQLKKFIYHIIWNNPYYNLPTNDLEVQVLDLSKALIAVPPVVFIPMAQQVPENSAITKATFYVQNVGTVPLTDIQISRAPDQISANIGENIHPITIDSILPGQQTAVFVDYEVKIKAPTLDDMYYTVSGLAAGVKSRVEAPVKVVFLINSPGCLKASPQKIDFTLAKGEAKERFVTITNNCAEPVTITGIDKAGNLYQNAFGNNRLDFYPVNGASVITVAGTATFGFKLTAMNYGGEPGMPVRFIGRTAMSGLTVASDSILVSTEVTPENDDIAQDLKQVYSEGVPICEKKGESEDISFPVVVHDNCTGNNGYCDAYGIAELLVKKIDALNASMKQTVLQFDSQVAKSGCVSTAQKLYCPITDIGGDLKPVSFTFYMQNDVVTADLLRHLIESTNNNIKNFMVLENANNRMNYQGLAVVGNNIYLNTNISGCGKYKVTIDGYVATTADKLLPEKAYYFVNLEKYDKTEQCSKEIENFKLYVPLDRDLKKKSSYFTWLSILSGREDVGKGVAKSIFGDEDRFTNAESLSSRNNVLNISLGDVKENTSALAKISFDDPRDSNIFKPEKINVLVNNKYAIDSALPQKMVDQTTKVINVLIKGDSYAEVCISEKKDYLLILSIVDVSPLTLTPKNDSVAINTGEVCKEYSVKSEVDELVDVSYRNPSNDLLEIRFKHDEQSYADKLPLELKSNEEAKFSICFKPKNAYIGGLIDKNIGISVVSNYETKAVKGKLNYRHADAELKLTSCGITPLELLEKMQNIINGKDNTGLRDGATVYALVSWDNGYSKKSSESICDAIAKFNGKNGKSAYFYEVTGGGCDLESTEARNAAKVSKGFYNAGTYFKGCMAACSACTAGSDVLINVIPGLGQAKIAWDILMDCGLFTCGIPAAGILINESKDSDVVTFLDKQIRDFLLASHLVGRNSDIRVLGDGSAWISKVIGVTLSGADSGVKLKNSAPVKLGADQSLQLPDFEPKAVYAETPAVADVGKAVEGTDTGNIVPFAEEPVIPDGAPEKIISKYTISRDEYKNIKSSIDAQKKTIASELDKVEKQIKALEGQKPKKVLPNTAKKIRGTSKIDMQIADLTASKKSLENAKTELEDLDNVFKDLKLKNNIYDLSEDAVAKLDDFKTKNIKFKVPAGVTKGSKWLNFGVGFAKGVVCGTLGVWGGSTLVASCGEAGQLNGSVMLDSGLMFEKNTLYEVAITTTDGRYEINVEKFDGSTIDDSQRLDKCAPAGTKLEIAGTAKNPLTTGVGKKNPADKTAVKTAGDEDPATDNSQLTFPESSQDITESIVENAQSFLGVPYIWSGRDKWGLDCVGLQYATLVKAGYLDPKTANVDIIFSNGWSILPYVADQRFVINRVSASVGFSKEDLDEIQPGDFLYFSKGPKEEYVHAAIYIDKSSDSCHRYINASGTKNCQMNAKANTCLVKYDCLENHKEYTRIYVARILDTKYDELPALDVYNDPPRYTTSDTTKVYWG